MRYIARAGREPRRTWLAQAESLLQCLRDAPDVEERHAIIDRNSRIWRELRSWLLELSHGKCWFSEARDCFSHFEVEHFRPKKLVRDADGSTSEGYWWLAFEWSNLRICGNVGNRSKGGAFPLRDGCRRCGPFGDLRQEEAQLLDPADAHDPALLSFDLEGHAIAAPAVSDEWEKSRVEYSIMRLKLDFPPLMDKRKSVWAECWATIQEYTDELDTYHRDRSNLIAREGFKRAAARIREMMGENQELSAVARACVLGTGDGRIIGFVQTT